MSISFVGQTISLSRLMIPSRRCAGCVAGCPVRRSDLARRAREPPKGRASEEADAASAKVRYTARNIYRTLHTSQDISFALLHPSKPPIARAEVLPDGPDASSRSLNGLLICIIYNNGPTTRPQLSSQFVHR